MIRRPIFLTVAISTALVAASVSAVTHNLTPTDDWVGIFNNPNFLNPGDEIVLGAGTYLSGTRLSMGYRGTLANPVTVRAADGADVIIKYPNLTQNVLNIEGAQYLTIKDIEFTGGSAGIRITEKNGFAAKYITLDGNHIHHTAAGAVTANNSNQIYEGMHFLRNEINDTGQEGEGFYLGCNNNACQFRDGIIEQNYIHHLNGPTVTQGDGIEIKKGSYNNIIRDNVIHDTKFPGILAYGVEGQGARNVIERNILWNIENHAIQVAADADIRNNIILGADIAGIASQVHQGVIPGNLTISNNTVRATGVGINIGWPDGGAYSGPIEVVNNAVYADGWAAINHFVQTNFSASGNVGIGSSPSMLVSEFDPSGNLSTDFIDFVNGNAFPATGSALIGAGEAIAQPSDDFNTTSRTGTADAGAYVYNVSGNPGWSVVPGFKGFPAPGLPGDFDGDDNVDGADFLKWQRDGALAANLLLWEANFGTQGGGTLAAATTVPEPTTLVLLLVGLSSFLSRLPPLVGFPRRDLGR